MRWLAIAVSTGVFVVSTPSSPAAEPPTRVCDERSWVAGVTEWCDGDLVYRDHVYDDYGADTGPQSPHGTGLNRPAGDVDHRDHGQALNSADLRVLRIALDGRTLRARFELNTLFPNDRTIAAMALDLDGDQSTGGGAWNTAGVRSRGWEQVIRFDQRDPVSNVIEGTATLDQDPGERIRVQAVVALGDGTPMNVAFRPAELGSWWEERQAAALSRGDVSRFGAIVETSGFGIAHRPARSDPPGFYDRVYRSDHPIGEGVSAEGVPGETTATFHYLGAYQPFAVYVPRTPPPHGVQLVLHGASANHASIVNQEGMQARFGEELDRILVSPLGRGPSNSYVDWGARDALDALADVERNDDTDADRVFISGYSMGGGGTLFLSSMFPDRFAGAVDWVGFTGDCLNGTPFAQGRQRVATDPTGTFTNSASDRDGCPLGTRGNFLDYIDNMRHVPTAHLFALADELVWANHAVAVMRRSNELGYEHVVWSHAAEHLTFAIVDDWRKEAAWTKGREVVRRPARVTYRTNAYLWMRDVDLIPDGAYWVDEMKPRDDAPTPAGDMIVDLVSHRCDPQSERTVETSYAAGIDPVPWFSQEAQPVGHLQVRPADRISGTALNVREFTINTTEACFAPGAEIDLDVHVDGPTTVRFTDGRPPLTLS